MADAYTRGVLVYENAQGSTEIPEKFGLKQVCPLSPLLFDLYSGPVLRAVEELRCGFPLPGGRTLGAMAFADDLKTLLATTRVSAQRLLITAEAALEALGLDAEWGRCAALYISYRK